MLAPKTIQATMGMTSGTPIKGRFSSPVAKDTAMKEPDQAARRARTGSRLSSKLPTLSVSSRICGE